MARKLQFALAAVAALVAAALNASAPWELDRARGTGGRRSGAPARYAPPVLRRLADRVSLRSRRRKFDLFL